MSQQEDACSRSFDHNDADSLYELAVKYELGNGVKKDIGKAISLYEQSAVKNHAESQFSLGGLSAEGVSLEKEDRKSTCLNSSHRCISYAVFCLQKKSTE